MNKFSIQQTNLCKGIAICIMLFHHLFFSQDSWPLYYYKLRIGEKPLIGFIATQGKVCVAIFVLLSAYGLTFSFSKGKKMKICAPRRDLKFVLIHIVKLYELYWPVFILAMITGLITNISNPTSVYKSFGEGIRDFWGVAYIFDGETPFNGAWWYISFAITLYLIFPILHKIMERYPIWMLVASFIIGVYPMSSIPIFIEWRRYLFICCLGIYLAQKNILGVLVNKKNRIIRIGISLIFCIVFFLIRCIHPFTFDGFFAVAIIVCSVSTFETTKLFNKLLVLLGQYSGTMFLLHGLLYKNFMRKFVYGFKYPVLIFFVLLGLSFWGSFAIENIKKKLKLVVIKGESYGT